MEDNIQSYAQFETADALWAARPQFLEAEATPAPVIVPPPQRGERAKHRQQGPSSGQRAPTLASVHVHLPKRAMRKRPFVIVWWADPAQRAMIRLRAWARKHARRQARWLSEPLESPYGPQPQEAFQEIGGMHTP